MKNFPRFLIVFLCLCFANIAFSQKRKGNAVIYKNYNLQAAGLIHKLNATKDTLILQSERKINYLYTANRKDEGRVKVRVDGNSYKLPLNRLKKGRNVMVAIQSPLKIVFVVNVLKEFPRPFNESLTAIVD
ncbi:hypothetical protein ACFQ1Q_08870 [Winogradskyella litorisediminis]|uniref:Uncharacterized protein n=1 Tax=Winogradskyella litorisediminis TaxID=1156618 RepID=A0ABW3N8R5_9FLAO